MLFAFEGIDASGKNTQSRLLSEWLRSKGMRCEYLSFPDYSTAIGQEIQAFLSGRKNYAVEARHMLYSINRYEHKPEIEKWLNDTGSVVVINRYCDSNLAYGGASGLSIEWLRGLESMMPGPDYVFYLKATPELSKTRKANRDRFETDLEFLERVSHVYDTLAESVNWFSVDARDSVQAVHYEIMKLAEGLLEEKRRA